MRPRLVANLRVSELLQQRFELIAAAVDIADDVERTVLGLAVVPEWLTREDGGVDFFLRLQHVNVTEAFAAETAQRTVELALLVANNVRPKIAVWPRAIPVVADSLGKIQNNGDGQHVVFARQRDQRLPRLGLNVGRVDDRQASTNEPARSNKVQCGEGIIRRGLVVLVVRHECPESVRRQHLCWLEVLSRERRLAAARRSNQDDQRELGNREGHRTNTAI